MFIVLQPNQDFNFLPEEEAQVFDLLAEYVGEDPYWFYKPWRSSRALPEKSGVYATTHWTHHGKYYGFTYFDAERKLWLQSFDNVESARSMGEDFRTEMATARDIFAVMSSYKSWHQEKCWSEAPLAGVYQMPYFGHEPDSGKLRANDDALSLALLRQAVDPHLKRKTCKSV
jgi:hypothetical protein